MKNKIFFYSVGIIFIVLLGSLFLSSQTKAIPSELSQNQDALSVKLSVKNGNYILEPSEFKINQGVRIIADVSSMPGCSKSIVVPSFGVRKTVTSEDNYIEFTPDKAGTFNIVCSMNMYKGTFTVLENNGEKSNFVEQNINSGSSCGMGGCGCGGTR